VQKNPKKKRKGSKMPRTRGTPFLHRGKGEGGKVGGPGRRQGGERESRFFSLSGPGPARRRRHPRAGRKEKRKGQTTSSDDLSFTLFW